MVLVPNNFVMGINFSNDFQSQPIDSAAAASQLAPLVGMAKTFSLTERAKTFMDQATRRKLPLCVGAPNDMIKDFANNKVTPFINAIRDNANNICWIGVGNEPLGSWYNNAYTEILAPAVENLYSGLQAAGLKQIGVTVPQNFEFMANSYPPSAGKINDKLVSVIARTCKVMRASGGPFMVNIYPYLTRLADPVNVHLDYCLFNASPEHWVRDGQYTYKNIFDAMLDALHVALNRIGFGDLEIVVGECGWPTAEGQDANLANAQTFVQNMISHCRSGSGTPRNPNKKIRCFVFEAYDEDLKDTAPGLFERHWGVFDASGKQKYLLNWFPSR